MQRTRIKFCGMTRLSDALAAAELGVDAIGVVLVPSSRRCIPLAIVAQMRTALPPMVSLVGLFQDAAAETVRAALAQVRFDLLQFHGDEPADYCAQFGVPYLRAIAMGDSPDLHQCANTFAQASALLLDSHSRASSGGSGQRFVWSSVPQSLPCKVILAGGLTAQNVAEGIAVVQPWAVDVSSGIESAPGVKDLHKMRAFVSEVSDSDVKRTSQRSI